MRMLALLLISAISLASSSAFAASYQQIDGTIVDPIRERFSEVTHSYTGINLEPNAALTNATLTNAILAYADLANATLTNADLNGADLGYVDLSGATLTGADLSIADVVAADLTGAILNSATLHNANLLDADLTNTSLLEADLRGATLTGAILTGVGSRGIIWNSFTVLPTDWTLVDGFLIGPGANLALDNLNNATLTGANLSFANFFLADLSFADLTGATLANATGLGDSLGAALYDINTDFTGTGFDPVAAGWTLVPVPEPGTALLMGLGLAGLAARRR